MDTGSTALLHHHIGGEQWIEAEDTDNTWTIGHRASTPQVNVGRAG
jgi:hypothetical protein